MTWLRSDRKASAKGAGIRASAPPPTAHSETHWDVFISHASEDKQSVAIPLSEILERLGFSVWLDVGELHVGDSLSEKINQGLAKSSLGIVILSPNFFSKVWPQRELAGLFASEEIKPGKVILPVWHNIEKTDIIEISPILADRLAVRTDIGLEQVGVALRRAILANPAFPIQAHPSTTRLFADILENHASPNCIVDFLKLNGGILKRLLKADDVIFSPVIGGIPFDIATRTIIRSSLSSEWTLIKMLPPTISCIADGKPTQSVVTAVREATAAVTFGRSNSREAQKVLPGVNIALGALIFSGRRADLTESDRDALKQLNEKTMWVSVRSYDLLLESTLPLERDGIGS